MADAGRRNLERRWRITGAVDDEARYLQKRIRDGEIDSQALALAALLGHPAARMTEPDYARTSDLKLFESVRSQVLNVFGRPSFDFGNVPEAARAFIENIHEQALEASVTLAHYGLVEAGDKAPPQPAVALEALAGDLKTNPGHMNVIAQMNKPVLQLIPVYKPEGAGFQRMITALNNHRREDLGQVEETFVRGELQNRWGMNAGASGKIVGWQVAVVEGDKELPDESNPHRNETLGEQLRLWQEECAQRGFELSDNRSYALLQMREIMTAPAGTPLRQLGIDPNTFTVLKDSTRQTGSFVPFGDWNVRGVYFSERRPGYHLEDARFRPAVVVKKIL